MKNIFNGIKKVHLIGAGGIGMSGIAEYLAKKKFIVTGSDANPGQITKRLEKFSVKISKGHAESNLPDDTELVIYTSAVKDDNEELQKAKRLNITTVKRAEALGNIVNDKFLIAVSGTHGKTTTTAMIAKVLIDSKNDPTVFVGGNLEFLNGGTSRIGKSEIAVVEADEYDRSFLTLKPDIIVITNIEADHLDIFKDLDDIKSCFGKFISNGKQGLKVIGCGDDENILSVLSASKQKILYGFNKNNNYRITDISYNERGLTYNLGKVEIRLNVLGRHNILNSAAAYIVADEFKVSDEGFNDSIKTFTGVKRRLELKFNKGIKVYDDYAHHPTEVKASLEALKKNHKGRIITVFQPHLYSRTRDFYKEFGEAFSIADVLMLMKIYPAREKELKGMPRRSVR